jgi:hypothetical protein
MEFLINNPTQAQLGIIQGSWDETKMVASCCFSMHSVNHRLLEIRLSLMTANTAQEHYHVMCSGHIQISTLKTMNMSFLLMDITAEAFGNGRTTL